MTRIYIRFENSKSERETEREKEKEKERGREKDLERESENARERERERENEKRSARACARDSTRVREREAFIRGCFQVCLYHKKPPSLCCVSVSQFVVCWSGQLCIVVCCSVEFWSFNDNLIRKTFFKVSVRVLGTMKGGDSEDSIG